MSPGLAGRLAIVCAIVCSAFSAHAQAPGARGVAPLAPVSLKPVVRRPVAVIDLAGDEKTTRLANELHSILDGHVALKTIVDANDLMGAYVDEDGINTKAAEEQRMRAQKELANHQLTTALSTAQAAMENLHRAVPTPAVIALYADLAFIAGAARLGDKKPVEAALQFALSDRLVPGRKIDDDTTTPDVIAAFEAARTAAATAAKVPVMIKGSGRAWVDGKELGATGVYDLTVGLHVVWLTGPDRITAGQYVVIEAGRSNLIEISDAVVAPRTKIRRARIALKNAVDASARAGAMKALAQLLKVNDAVLLTVKNDKVVVQTWRDQAPGFSALYEYKGEGANDLLEPLSPTPRPEVVDPPWNPPIETPWYRKRKVQMSALATVVVIVGIVIATSIDGNTPLNPNAGFQNPNTIGR